MTSFGWLASLAGPGQFVCQIGFEAHPVEEAWRDEDGQAWDVCTACHDEDAAAVVRKLLAEQDEDEGDEDAESGGGADGGDDG